MFYTILPKSVITIIFSYDSTYHDIYKYSIKQIYTFGFKTRLQSNIYSNCMKNSDLIGDYRTTFSRS